MSTTSKERPIGRLVAIGIVWLGCTFAWLVLGTTVVARSGDMSNDLTSQVHALWGEPMVQLPPTAFAGASWKDVPSNPPPGPDAEARERAAPGTPEAKRPAAASPPPTAAAEPLSVPLSASAIDVALDHEHRRKGLLWFATYAVDFQGSYSFEHGGNSDTLVRFEFPLQAGNALYDGFEVLDARGESVDAAVRDGVARWQSKMRPGETSVYRVKYRSRGTTSWHYEPAAGTSQVKNFRLSMKTDFPDVDFPAGTLSPSTHSSAGDAWNGDWSFKTLVASSRIGVELPQKLNPGPLVARITFFAPVGLLFFFFVVAILAAAQGEQMHPMNYFFFGCAFFAFHLLFSYLVDHVSIFPSFLVASAVSVALVVSYARWFVGWRFALREMGAAQVVYLVMFSFTFFWQGFTGLAVTIGAILTLFVMMQITGRKRWGTGERPDSPERSCPTPYRCRPQPAVVETPVVSSAAG